MDTDPATDPVTVLSPEAAWDLLRRHNFGRLATCALGEPEIFPVNFIVSDTTLVFRTAPGTKLLTLIINTHVALEIDELDTAGAVSVVVKGVARLVDSQAEIDALGAESLHPYVPTVKQQYVAVDITQITGRSFAFGEDPGRLPEL